MNVKGAIRKLLLEDFGIATATDGRVFSNFASQETRQPRVSMQILNTEPQHTTRGRSWPSAVQLEVLVLGEKESAVDRISRDIIAVLDRFARKTTPRTFGEITLHDAFLTNDVDGFDNYSGSTMGLYRRNLDFEVWYAEAN